MAKNDPALSALPGYQTRVSGVQNIRARDMYNPGVRNQKLDQFVELSESALNLAAQAEKTKQAEAKRAKNLAEAQAHADAERAKRLEERERALVVEATAKDNAQKGELPGREAVAQGLIHPTELAAYHRHYDGWQGSLQGQRDVATITQGWQALVDAQDPRTRDPQGYQTYFNESITKFLDERPDAKSPFYSANWGQHIETEQIRNFGTQEFKSRGRLVEHNQVELSRAVMDAAGSYAAATDDDGRTNAITDVDKALDTAYRMNLLTDGKLLDKMGTDLIDAILANNINPEKTKAFFESITTGTGKLMEREGTKGYYELNDTKIDAWIEKIQGTREGQFDADLSVSLTESNGIWARYVDAETAEEPIANRKDAITALDAWYEEWFPRNPTVDPTGKFQTHANYDPEGDRWIERKKKIDMQYSILHRKITTEAQNTATLKSNVTELVAISMAAEEDVSGLIMGALGAAYGGAVMEPGTSRNLYERLVTEVQGLVDPTTVGKGDNDAGYLYTEANAKKRVDKMIWKEVCTPLLDDPKALALGIANLSAAGYPTTEVSKWASSQTSLFEQSYMSVRAPEAGGWAGARKDQTLESLRDGLQSDPGENMFDHITEDGDMVKAFDTFAHIADTRGVAVARKTFGISSGIAGDVFEDAWGRGSGAPSVNRLASSWRAHRLNVYAPGKKFTPENRELMMTALQDEDAPISTQQWEVIEPLVQGAWSRIPGALGEDAAQEKMEEWAKDNVKIGNSHTRIGELGPINLSHFKNEGVFFERFAHDLRKELKGTILNSEEVTFLVVGDSDKGPLVFAMIEEADGTMRDLFDRGTKTTYSMDDLTHLYQGMVERDGIKDHEARRSNKRLNKRTGMLEQPRGLQSK